MKQQYNLKIQKYGSSMHTCIENVFLYRQAITTASAHVSDTANKNNISQYMLSIYDLTFVSAKMNKIKSLNIVYLCVWIILKC